VAFVDSAKIAIEKLRASGQFGRDGGGPQLFTRTVDGGPGTPRRDGTGGGDAPRTAPAPAAPAAPAPNGQTGPAPATNAQPGTISVTAGGNTAVTTGGPGGGAFGGQLPPLTMVAPSELPDYKPAFAPGSTRADAEGNLWIRTSQNVDARPVYDIINRKGELIDRVQLPANRVLAGFGAGGVVYLAVRDGATAHLERARVK